RASRTSFGNLRHKATHSRQTLFPRLCIEALRRSKLYDWFRSMRGRNEAVAARSGLRILLVAVLVAGSFPAAVIGQLLEPGSQSSAPNPLTDTTVKPGKVLLFDLETRFAKDVAARGGAAFADWFAEDGVALGNGAQPKIGKIAI